MKISIYTISAQLYFLLALLFAPMIRLRRSKRMKVVVSNFKRMRRFQPSLPRSYSKISPVLWRGYSALGNKAASYRHRRLNAKVTLYRKLPLRFMSRLWGQLNSVDVPHWLRKPAFSLYAWMFNCNLDEAAESDLTQYKNLSEFFRRQLKPHVRPVDSRFTVTSPADGRVLHLGKVEDCRLEQVKGVTYSLQGFLGPHTWNGKSEGVDDVDNEEKYHRGLLSSPDSELYHCIIYLAPGDYHRFHSPAKWNIKYRRHFPGDLLSVNPTVARWVQGLFNFNERVVYYGNWQHGFFSMTAVGATNVGSINVYFDPELNTNQRKKGPSFNKSFNDGIQCNKGDYFGEFNMGSTIVLIFEAPKNFEFNIRSGQKIRVGESVGTA